MANAAESVRLDSVEPGDSPGHGGWSSPLSANGSDSFSITDLAQEFGITPRTIRFYETEGLIAPERRGTTRVYSRANRARLAWVLRGRAVGFSLSTIRDLLDMYAPGPGRQAQLAAAAAKSRERIAALHAQRDAIDATILELEQFCRALEDKI